MKIQFSQKIEHFGRHSREHFHNAVQGFTFMSSVQKFSSSLNLALRKSKLATYLFPKENIRNETDELYKYTYQAIRTRHNSKTEYEPKPTTLQIGTGLALVCVLLKLAMMYDETQEPERIARKARELAKAQEKLEAMTKEKWEALQDIRPRTPFENQVGRNEARIRTGEPLKWAEVRDWAIDVLFEKMKQNEEAIKGSMEQMNEETQNKAMNEQ